MARGIGLDFGTTNSALALADADRSVRVVRFAALEGDTESFRSILFCGRAEGRPEVESVAGPGAIPRYLDLEGERRLLQSLKAFLASRLFTSTNLLGRTTTLQEMISRIVRGLLDEAETGQGDLQGTIVVGRPVRFARSRQPGDDDFAQNRLSDALRRAGVESFRFEFEPVAAAYHYEQSLDADELVLIADFGGGTSDFCLLRVGPGVRARGRRSQDILGTEGVAVAGDAFGARLVRNVVAPRLGRGSQQQKLFGQPVPVPAWIYRDLERWHHLSLLRSPRTLGVLHDVLRHAHEPEKIEALLHLVENDLGYSLYQAVEDTKTELSRSPEAWLRFRDPPAVIEERVTRADFESWIAPELDEIAACTDRLLARTGVSPDAVDRIFLTGGSSFVPAVRRIFESRFGTDRIRGGGELVSVARGLGFERPRLLTPWHPALRLPSPGCAPSPSPSPACSAGSVSPCRFPPWARRGRTSRASRSSPSSAKASLARSRRCGSSSPVWPRTTRPPSPCAQTWSCSSESTT